MIRMRCPLCEVPMKEIQRRNVMVDICPECKGVWLDRGELDKLLAAGNPWEEETPAPEYGHEKYRGKRRKNILKELFDFDLFD
ncbi:zf-TFIIB domain-containing protein [Neomoorella carbonis]|uniref:TFIIB-type zinc ribbon-containing protein n=1 Tax=Neomoorella carbonis TaxID=3062783 RepID=UPI003872F887